MRSRTAFGLCLLAALIGLIAIAYLLAGPVTALWMAMEGGIWIGLCVFGDRYLERKRRDEERGFVAALEARIDDAARLPSRRARDKD